MAWLTSRVLFVLSALLAVKSSQPATQAGDVDVLPALVPSELGASAPPLSSAYMIHPLAICLALFMHWRAGLLVRVRASAGTSIKAPSVTMPITTTNSTSVKALLRGSKSELRFVVIYRSDRKSV